MSVTARRFLSRLSTPLRVNPDGGLTGWPAYDGESNGSFASFTTNWDGVSDSLSVTGCSASLYVATYGVSGALKLIAATVSGVVSTVGTAVDVTSNSVTYAEVHAISSSKVIVAWVESAGCYVRTYTISGNTLTADVSATTVEPPTVNSVSVKALSSTRAVVTYGTPSATKAIGFTIGSGTLTIDASAITIAASQALDVGLGVISSTKAVAGYVLSASATTGRMTVITDGGSSLTAGTEVTFSTPGNGLDYVTRIDMCVESSGNVLALLGQSGAESSMIFATISVSTITCPSNADSTPYYLSGAAYMLNTGTERMYVMCGLAQGNGDEGVIVAASTGSTAGKIRIRSSSNDVSSFVIPNNGARIARLGDSAAVMIAAQDTSNVIRAKIIQA